MGTSGSSDGGQSPGTSGSSGSSSSDENCHNAGVQSIWENYGQGVAGCNGIPGLTMSGVPKLQTDPIIIIDNQGPPLTCGLFWSWTQGELYVPFLGGDILVGLPIIVAVTYTVPDGGFDFACAISSDCSQIGWELYLQLLCIDGCSPAGFSMSRGLRFRIGDL
ncbi:MAG: hypothetical protein KDB80_07135 [Planctomycetes bacterium]|nr:hypothetical protein [Planctomycetota bacterium]